MLVRDVSLHNTIDTPSHMPAHTRQLEQVPLYNIPLAELAYNYSVHGMMRMISSWAMYHRNLGMYLKATIASNLKSLTQADATF